MSSNLNFYKNKVADIWPNDQEIAKEFIFYLKEHLNLKDTSIYIDKDYLLSNDEQEGIEEFIKHKKDGLPLDYILKKSFFYGNEFLVDQRVLIPRPETELLVDHINTLNFPDNIKILDAGTGSGCIGISIAMHNPNVQVYGLDYSAKSLEVAKANKNYFELNNFSLIHSDWLSSIKDRSIDFIVSNPPYIDSQDIHLKDLIHEPASALVASDRGLGDFKVISQQASLKLRKDGVLLFEHGYEQASEVSKIMKKNGFNKIETFKDHQSHPRITKGII
ncbi:peptide chain release factor N(5)-glutamine methyltransferase [Gammaproteobacteria bacterium]|nr:peptide chain release factor N(5)-glutamine methyltransferase [Gammaproteobacteria bacterium]MDA7829205.1 peptide chain release factor N(5)-glutamine methyltransferase [Gammaproteobacteria bacterium]MDA7845051.1 peptide chain release factor N(5)-glutamine methyltransferase [Gammaproteobacteria bacterium]MDA8955759.1 peptide chain release factor N(5)-glutamine methyltransferase [Gammaproteobacteria bacterium]MDA9039996.1 peptide chain release factor N(5)-glutamine methyltransferase [Gammaprot